MFVPQYKHTIWISRSAAQFAGNRGITNHAAMSNLINQQVDTWLFGLNKILKQMVNHKHLHR